MTSEDQLGQPAKPQVLFIVGQTASGKSSLAIQAAKELGGEIICADSLTVYKGLDIGTAKPSKSDRQEVAHHLLDVADQNRPYTVADFQSQAKQKITDILTKGNLPIVVGGSGLYIDSLLYDYKLGPAKDSKARAELEAMTIEQLQAIITKKNLAMPENKQNKRYLVRTIELKRAPANNKVMRKDSLVVGLRCEKKDLEARIKKRLKKMMNDGLLVEAEWATKTYSKSSEALKGNAYQELNRYLNNEYSLEEALEAIIRQDLKLAKKQDTWFKRNKNISWFSDQKTAFNFIKNEL